MRIPVVSLCAMTSSQWPPDPQSLARLWLNPDTVDVWQLIDELNSGVKFKFSQRSHCIVGQKNFSLYPGCPTQKNEIDSSRLKNLAACLILTAPRAAALADMRFGGNGLVAVAEETLANHPSLPPAF